MPAQAARLAYSLLWICALPLVLARLAWRARRQPEYLRHVAERLGAYAQRAPGRPVWIHAVSVGETRAAQPLVRAILDGDATASVLLTHMTPTGRATADELFGQDQRVRSVYLPYDLPWTTTRFLKHFRPRLGIVMETELWPNLLAAARDQNVPMMLANARLSERSARRYARWPTLTRLTLGALSAVGAQTKDDAGRLSGLGAREVEVSGNIKFDIEPPATLLELGEAFRARIGGRPTLLAASTREGEEAAILDAFAAQAPGNALLLLVPRHPQRFEAVAELVARRGLSLQRRSDNRPVARETRVWLGDSMGEMFAYYAAADVTLMGGTWLPFGGQNLIEACAVGTPVVLGPHTYNFALAADQAVAAGAALRAQDVRAGMGAALALLSDAERREHMGLAGRSYAAAHRGATGRTMEIVRRLMR